MSKHDWRQYEESPGNGRSNWLVWEDQGGGWAVEVYLVMGAPAEVALVKYGPRGGTRTVAGGTIEQMKQEIDTLTELIVAARKIEALR
jgi:hypothetical protein